MEVFLSQPGLVQTPLNARKLDHSKIVAIGVDLATKVYGQSATRGSLCLQRPATDPNVSGTAQLLLIGEDVVWLGSACDQSL